jgi:hypothetical protein
MDDENNNTSPFLNSQSLALRIQKKIASKMSNKAFAKIFIDDTTGRILDNLFKLVKEYSRSKKQAETIINSVIKIIIKIGLLYKNEQLNSDELRQCDAFRQTFHLFVKAALSFYEVDYTFDNKFLHNSLKNCQSLIQNIVKLHLTEKSKQKIENVFNFFSDPHFLESVFASNSSYSTILKSIVDDTRVLVDEGSL